MKKIWPFTFYFLYFAAFSSALPFFVLFYQGLGFSGTQIGLLTVDHSVCLALLDRPGRREAVA